MTCIHVKKENKLAEYNLLHDIMNHTQITKNHYKLLSYSMI